MFLFKKYLAVTAFSMISLIFSSNLFATNIYVDKTLSSNCSAGNYSTANKNCGGSDGDAYTTIQGAVNNMNKSDDIFIRGDTYYENVLISASNAPDGTANDYASMQSYPGEWAIVDGQNSQQYTIGKNRSGRDSGNDLAYWRFEKLEITGGTRGDGGAGLYISGGPFIVRYNYIHDNVASSAGENPAGIVGYTWKDSIIEYNYFDNNGMSKDTSGNAAHIAIFSDYLWDTTGRNGFTNSIPSVRRNEIRYNYFSGSTIGFKHKGTQYFTGRNTASPSKNYDDTYQDWGDKIHHNYFTGQRRVSVMTYQDFAQVYNNIFDNIPEAITIGEQPDDQMYKAVTYNNTIINSKKGIVRYGCDEGLSYPVNENHYGWDYNNIIDSSTKTYQFWFTGTAINVLAGCSNSRNPMLANADVSNYISSNNYFYRADDPDIFKYGDVYYTASGYEAQTETGTPKTAYSNAYDAGNPLYAGTTFANKFITLESHLIEGSTTTANGGIGIPHPYLSGVTLPSYVGAVDPNNNSWVAGILCLTDIYTLKNGSAGGPVCSKRPKAIDTLDATVIRN